MNIRLDCPYSAMFLSSNSADTTYPNLVHGADSHQSHSICKEEMNFKSASSFGKVKKAKHFKFQLCCSGHAWTVTQALVKVLHSDFLLQFPPQGAYRLE